MKIAITGCLGFLGMHLMDEVLKTATNTVVGLCRGNDFNLRYKESCKIYDLCPKLKNITFLECDITKPKWGLSNKAICALNNVDLLIHAAGNMNALKHVDSLYATNIQPVKLFTRLDVPHIIHISSLAVFVSSDWERNNSIYPTSSIADLHWTNGYAESKAIAENMIREMPVPITIIRPSHITSQYTAKKDLLLHFNQAMKKLKCRPEVIRTAEINTVHVSNVIKDILSSKPGQTIHSFGNNQSLIELCGEYEQVDDKTFKCKINKLAPIERIIIRNSFFRPQTRWKELDIFLSTGCKFADKYSPQIKT